MSEQIWAKEWLRSVARALRDRQRAKDILEASLERARCAGSSIGETIHHNDGSENRTEKNMIGLVQAEADYETANRQATEACGEFDEMYYANKSILEGTLGDALDVIRLKFRMGMKEKDIMDTLHISRTKLYHDQRALIEYFDFIGKTRALHPDQGDELMP